MDKERKQEQIGQVTLDYTWYAGRDLYSDGDEENRLLELVKESRETDYDSVIAREANWTVLYHLSPVRENILGGLAIGPEETVLEIGSGCGAVTGALLDRCASLTCVDLSRRRSVINAQRHRDKKPYTILVGNFEDMEPSLPAYDLITLIGVFEYARGYIGQKGEDPYREFLRQVSAHVKPGGRIVVAIENRLGLKYFAGSAEDHTGVYFDGIENYPDERASARTFSRPALEEILTEGGLTVSQFAYPYPDYKLPAVIHTDACLPKPGELRRNRWNFDRKKLEILDEDRTLDSILRDGLYPQFANSFLVTLRREEETSGQPSGQKKGRNGRKKTAAPVAAGREGEQAVYTRFSDERDPAYALKTQILRDENGNTFVRKTACRPEGNAHILRLAESGKELGTLLEGTGIGVNRVLAVREGKQGTASADLEWIDCSLTLDDQVHALAMQGQIREAMDLVREVCARIAPKAAEPFAVTEEFRGLFSMEDYPFTDVTLPVTDIDMVPENLIPDGRGGYTLIDYEWTYGFPVPLRFVLFRIWHYFAVGCLGEENAGICCAREGFSTEEIRVFRKMEAAWQNQVKGKRIPLRELYGRISPGFTDGKAVLGIRRQSGDTEFISTLAADGKDIAVTSVLTMDSAGGFSAAFDLEELFTQGDEAGGGLRGVKRLRWDPLENVICRMKIRKVRAAVQTSLRPMNGYTGEDGWDTFWTTDPVYDVELDLDTIARLTGREKSAGGEGRESAARPGTLVIEGELETVNLYDHLEQIDQIQAERDAYFREMENLRRRIEAIRSTKAYKATEGLRRARNFTMARVRGTKMFRDKNAGPKKYQEWLEEHRADEKTLSDQRKMILPFMPRISVLVPVFRTPEPWLRAMIESVQAQSYGNWELCIADASAGSSPPAPPETGESGGSETARIIREYASRDPRIKLKELPENNGISANSNAAADLASGEYVAMLDHDDLLAPDALFEAAQAISVTGAPVLYTDEDKVNMPGTDHFEPSLKPEFSPDLLRSHNYITHLFVVKRELFEQVGRFDSRYDGAQDYDLILRCTEKAEQIVHIPRILYHWRSHESSTAQNPESKLYAYEAGRAAVQAHLDRLGIKARVRRSRYWGINRVLYPVSRHSLVSVIIPNKDHSRDLERCLTSLFEVNTFPELEVIVVENNSEEPATFAFYEQARRRWPGLRILRYEGAFNYAAVNNFGAAAARGDLLLLLNNDTQLIRPDSIREMAGIASRKDVGCVGAKLLYGNGTVQHAGIVLGFGGFAGHVFVGIGADSPGVMMRPLMVCNYSAVTAACLMVRKKVYEELGGLNEAYAVALNDVDFCLRALQAGYLNVYTPWSRWYHFESLSRGYEDTPEKQRRLRGEVKRFRRDWGDLLEQGDPYYNPNFPLDLAPFSLY